MTQVNDINPVDLLAELEEGFKRRPEDNHNCLIRYERFTKVVEKARPWFEANTPQTMEEEFKEYQTPTIYSQIKFWMGLHDNFKQQIANGDYDPETGRRIQKGVLLSTVIGDRF